MNHLDAELLFAFNTIELKLQIMYGCRSEDSPVGTIKACIQELLKNNDLTESAKGRLSREFSNKSNNSIKKSYLRMLRDFEEQAKIRFFIRAYSPHERLEVVEAMLHKIGVNTVNDYDGDTQVMLTKDNRVGAVLFDIAKANDLLNHEQLEQLTIILVVRTSAVFHACKNVFNANGFFCIKEPKYKPNTMLTFKLYIDDLSDTQSDVIAIGEKVAQATNSMSQ